MSLYAIGDVQGCDASLERLLRKIPFRKNEDQLWLVGDLVNRGPDSVGVLRRVKSLGKAVTCVLGNHDLHLLAVAAGVRRLSASDTFDDVLDAPDADDLLNWLRKRPLVHFDADANRLLVHAGIPPTWSIKQALKHAAYVEHLLSGRNWKAALRNMYGNFPHVWSKKLSPKQRFRFTINGLTRMRFCDALGRLDFNYSGPPGTQPKRLMPWFRVADRPTAGTHIVFGHWAALGIHQTKYLTGLDSGCVWGRSLTAVQLKKKRSKDTKTRVNCRHRW